MSESSPILPAHRSQGTGPPLVVLHGLFGSGTNWRSIVRGLEDCRTLHVLDARNHGGSEHREHMDYPALAADVLRFMDEAELESADVLGHSMGGKTAMRLALDAPSRVRSLMVVDIAPAVSGSDHVPLIDALLALPLDAYSRRGEADTALAATVPEPGLRAFLLQNLVSGPEGLRWRLNLPVIKRCMSELLAFDADAGTPYAGRTLFVRGEQSDYIAPGHEEVMQRLFPAGRIHTVSNAGHWVHAEQPAAFLAVAREFYTCSGA